MRLNSKTVIGLGIIFITLVGFVTFLFKGQENQPPAPQIIVPPAPTLGIIQPASVVFTFSSPPSVPKTLPSYTYQDYSREQLMSNIKNNLSSFDIPQLSSTLSRAGVFRESWLGDGAEFIFSQDENSSVISFRQFKAASPPATKRAPVAAATRFVTDLVTPPEGVTLTEASTTKDVSEGLLILDSFIPSFVVGTTFSYLVSGFPIVSPPHTIDATTVAIDNYGILRAATIVPPPRLLAPAGESQLLSADGVLANLSQKRGAIISAGRSGSDTTGLVDFHSFSVDKVVVVYARSGGFLRPAFLLHGFGINSLEARQEATFFLWATAQ